MAAIDKVLSYVYNAFSFVLDREVHAKIKAAYLFGSAVRGGLTETSDIDIFIDCEEKYEDWSKKRTEANLAKFYNSADFKKWRHLGITNPISVTAGQLERWALKTSIYSEGIIIFNKTAVSAGKGLIRKVLIIFDLPKHKPKYLRFVRQLFGRKEYLHKGHLEEVSGSRVAPNAIIIPQEKLSEVEKFLQRNKVKYRLMQFFTQEGFS